MNAVDLIARLSPATDIGKEPAATARAKSDRKALLSGQDDAWAAEKAHDHGEDRAVLAEAKEKLDAALGSLGLKLKYHVDESTDKLQVEVIEPDSGKVLRKLPPDDILKLARSVQEMARGFLDKMY